MSETDEVRGALANDSAGHKLFPAERQARIVEMLSEQPKILAVDLAREFDVSSFTVRADLAALESKGLLKRCYGGAISMKHMPETPAYVQRSSFMAEEKRRIGIQAASFVQNGDYILVDTGTTTIELVKALDPALKLTIVTNDIAIADYVERNLPLVDIFLLGGDIRHGYRYTSGPMVLEQLGRFNADKAFLSANGYVEDGGFTCEDTDQALIKRALIKRAGLSILLMDGTKFGRRAFYSFASEKEIDILITDKRPADEFAEQIGSHNKHLQLIVSS